MKLEDVIYAIMNDTDAITSKKGLVWKEYLYAEMCMDTSQLLVNT